MPTNLQKIDEVDEPKELTRPRTVEEAILFRSITQQWANESDAHRPEIAVYETIEADCENFATYRVDFSGLVEPVFCGECSSQNDFQPMGNWRSTPHRIDGETVYIARMPSRTNVIADQVERFAMLLESHESCPSDDLEPFAAQQVASNLAMTWAVWGDLDMELGYSIGSFLVAASGCNIRVCEPIKNSLESIRLDRKFGRRLDGPLAMMKKSWINNPEGFSVIAKD